jgi:hypothetical protein
VFRTENGPDRASDLVVIPKPAIFAAPTAELLTDYRTILNRLFLSK